MHEKLKKYRALRRGMRSGDVIAFGGKGRFSEIIKMATRSPVSHVGVVLLTAALTEPDGRYFNMVIESTQIGDFAGVTINRLSDRILAYDGDAWWLPVRLNDAAKEPFFDFLMAQDGKPYDMKGAIQSGLDALDLGGFGPTSAKEDYSKLFCSELVAGAFKACGVLPSSVNPAEVTPIDLCRFPIYSGPLVKLLGSDLDIPGYNGG